MWIASTSARACAASANSSVTTCCFGVPPFLPAVPGRLLTPEPAVLGRGLLLALLLCRRRRPLLLLLLPAGERAEAEDCCDH